MSNQNSSDKANLKQDESQTLKQLEIDIFGTKEKSGNSFTSPIPEDFRSCNHIWERFSKCMSTGYQMSHIHKYGASKGCMNRFADFRKCIHVKFIKDPNEIMRVYRGTEYYEDKYIIKNDIFEYKEKPSWD
mmetsp:Transcript_17421/g.18890  ORF Transcript_17421/g.18890 Transcript_17421/m.18890 type:complete len:131 (+) Transcript_17421:28-420(+)